MKKHLFKIIGVIIILFAFITPSGVFADEPVYKEQLHNYADQSITIDYDLEEDELQLDDAETELENMSVEELNALID